MRRTVCSVLVSVLFLGGCGVLAQRVESASRAYDAAEYDDAEVWLSDVEDDVGEMSPDLAARFYYLRGMTAYRKGHRDDALHYLALAREMVEEGARLPAEDTPVLERTLAELVPTTPTWHAQAAPVEN